MTDERSPLNTRQQVYWPERKTFEYKIAAEHYVKFAPAPTTGIPWPLPQFYYTQVVSSYNHSEFLDDWQNNCISWTIAAIVS